MLGRAGQAPKKSLRALAARTAAATVAGGLFTALVVALITSDGVHQVQERRLEQRTAIDVRILPALDERLIIDTLDAAPESFNRFHDGQPSRGHVPEVAVDSIYESTEFKQQLSVHAKEKPGVVSRLNSSVQQPLGAARTVNDLCWPFNESMKSVAIVGNGPLTMQDRLEIDKHDVVVRFNLMNNWHRFLERVDVWIMRYSTEASAGYWGINNINSTEATRILESLSGIWLVGGQQAHADRLAHKHPALLAHHPVLMPEAPMNKAFAAGILRSPRSYPSTGFVGIQGVLHCTGPATRLFLYGFNWSTKTWRGHNVGAEKAFVRGLEEAGRAVVRATACGGMRECGSGDIDASCHWSTSGRYLCLRGKPRKWIDMTASVLEARQRDFGTASGAASPS